MTPYDHLPEHQRPVLYTTYGKGLMEQLHTLEPGLHDALMEQLDNFQQVENPLFDVMVVWEALAIQMLCQYIHMRGWTWMRPMGSGTTLKPIRVQVPAQPIKASYGQVTPTLRFADGIGSDDLTQFLSAVVQLLGQAQLHIEQDPSKN